MGPYNRRTHDIIVLKIALKITHSGTPCVNIAANISAYLMMKYNLAFFTKTTTVHLYFIFILSNSK